MYIKDKEMQDIKDAKKAIRKNISAIKKTHDMEWKLKESEKIWSMLEQVDGFAESRVVLLYYALPDEVQTEGLIRKYYGKKKIVLPLVSGDDLLMKEYDPEKICSGYCSIPEPTADALDVDVKDIDFAVIPGVAFDRQCNRLGRGRGFYDRLLSGVKCPVYGISYDFQLVDQVPLEPFDKPLDGLVLPDEVIEK